MTPEESTDREKELIDGLQEMSDKCGKTCAAQERLLGAVGDMREMTRNLLTGQALYTQVSSVLRDMTDRERVLEHTMDRLVASVEKHNQSVELMVNSFRLFEDKAEELLACPLPRVRQVGGRRATDPQAEPPTGAV